MDCYTRQQIKEAVTKKGYKWFESGDYNINIVGVRNSDTHGKVTNRFDDCITVSYNINGEEKFFKSSFARCGSSIYYVSFNGRERRDTQSSSCRPCWMW